MSTKFLKSAAVYSLMSINTPMYLISMLAINAAVIKNILEFRISQIIHSFIIPPQIHQFHCKIVTKTLTPLLVFIHQNFKDSLVVRRVVGVDQVRPPQLRDNLMCVFSNEHQSYCINTITTHAIIINTVTIIHR